MMDPQAQTPDPYKDAEAIRTLVKRKHEAWTNPRPRAAFLQAAKGNLLFRQGEHWIRPANNQYGDWRPAYLKKGTPQPVTNLYASVMKTFTSLLARFEPALTFRPATAEPEDRATADVASRAIEVIQEEVEITPIRHLLSEWVGHTGGAWLETGWDASMSHGVTRLPMEICQTCGSGRLIAKAPTCTEDMGGQPCGGPMMSLLDEAGAPITQAMPRGKMFTEIRSLFEMVFNPYVSDPTKHRVLIVQKSVDLDDAKARWKDYAEMVQPDSMATGGTLTQDSLAVIGPNLGDLQAGSARMTWQGQSGGASNTRVTETWYWALPDEAYPDGLLAIFLGRGMETQVYAGPLPYYAPGAGGDREYFLPFVFFAQELVPGSAWPKTVANDVRPKNAQRNYWESLMLMAGQRISNPSWIVANGTNVSTFTGEPGQIVYWNALNGAPPPKMQPGMPINPSWMLNLERIDKEIQELTAMFEVMSGGRPEGISAGIALQILKERGESRFGPMFALWHYAWAQWAKQAIEIFRMFATEERVLRIKGRDGMWEVQKFLGADFTGRIDVVPEAGMSMPKSTMTDRAEAEQLVTMGAVNMADPEAQAAMLRLFCKEGMFKPGMESNAKRAIMENEGFDALGQALAQEPMSTGLSLRQFVAQMQMAGTPPPAILAQVEQQMATMGLPVPKLKQFEDHSIHGREHRLHATSERYDALPEVVQVFEELHIAAHDFFVGQAMQAQIAARQGAHPGGGFLAAPGPRQAPMSAGSSGQRMDGDNAEAEDKMARVG